METEDSHTSYSPGNDVDGKKRLRCSNFSSQEKNILIHIIEKYQDVIECKKTDKVSVQEREKVWEGIAQEFNEIVLAEPVRTSRQLKMCYENLKRRIRKEVFSEEQKPVKSNIDPVVALRSQVHVPSDVDSNSSTLLHVPQGKTPFIKRKELAIFFERSCGVSSSAVPVWKAAITYFSSVCYMCNTWISQSIR